MIQNLGPAKDRIPVDSETREMIQRHYAEDYRLLRDFYAPRA
jgi:hypothetical protein